MHLAPMQTIFRLRHAIFRLQHLEERLRYNAKDSLRVGFKCKTIHEKQFRRLTKEAEIQISQSQHLQPEPSYAKTRERMSEIACFDWFMSLEDQQ